MTDTQTHPVTAEARLEEVLTFFNQGEFFRAYDLAAETLELFPGNVALAHRAVPAPRQCRRDRACAQQVLRIRPR